MAIEQQKEQSNPVKEIKEDVESELDLVESPKFDESENMLNLIKEIESNVGDKKMTESMFKSENVEITAGIVAKIFENWPPDGQWTLKSQIDTLKYMYNVILGVWWLNKFQIDERIDSDQIGKIKNKIDNWSKLMNDLLSWWENTFQLVSRSVFQKYLYDFNALKDLKINDVHILEDMLNTLPSTKEVLRYDLHKSWTMFWHFRQNMQKANYYENLNIDKKKETMELAGAIESRTNLWGINWILLRKNPWKLSDIMSIDIESIQNLKNVKLFYDQLKWSTENTLKDPSSTWANLGISDENTLEDPSSTWANLDISDFEKYQNYQNYQNYLKRVEEISNEYNYDDIWEIKENVRKVGFNIIAKDILTDIGTSDNWDYLSQDNIKGFIKNVGKDWLYQIAYFDEIDNLYEISSDIKQKNQNIIDQVSGKNNNKQTLKDSVIKDNIKKEYSSFHDGFVELREQYVKGEINEITKEDLIDILPKKMKAE